MEHTKGPWIVNGTYPGIVDSRPHRSIIAGNRVVAYAPDIEDQHDANANLIAAAPDLLEACKAVRDLEYVSDHTPAYLTRPVYEMVLAAIARAEKEG